LAPGSLLVAVAATAAGGRDRRFGGGGGSFDIGLNPILVAGFQAGNGEVMITKLAPAAPEPSSLAMVGRPAGLTGLVATRRRSKT